MVANNDVQKQLKKLNKVNSKLVYLGISFIIIHVIINFIQSSCETIEAYLGWNAIRTYIFVGITIVFYIKWRQTDKISKTLMESIIESQ